MDKKEERMWKFYIVTTKGEITRGTRLCKCPKLTGNWRSMNLELATNLYIITIGCKLVNQ